MNHHVKDRISDCLRGHFNLPRDVDHFAREQAQADKARERRLMAHPDPADPDHPEDEE